VSTADVPQGLILHQHSSDSLKSRNLIFVYNTRTIGRSGNFAVQSSRVCWMESGRTRLKHFICVLFEVTSYTLFNKGSPYQLAFTCKRIQHGTLNLHICMHLGCTMRTARWLPQQSTANIHIWEHFH